MIFGDICNNSNKIVLVKLKLMQIKRREIPK